MCMGNGKQNKLMNEELLREMQEEDNAEYDQVETVSDVENEAGNLIDEEKKEYPSYSPMDSQTVDYKISNFHD